MTLWSTFLPHFTQNLSKDEKISLIEKGNISSDEEVCSPSNSFFANTVFNLNIPAIEHSHSNLQNTDLILGTVNSYEKLPSIEKIKNRSCNLMLSFRKTDSNEVGKIIDNLDIKKACQHCNILTKIIKLNEHIITPFVSENFNSCVDKGEFPDDLRHANIVPFYKKKSKTNKTNYMPVKILSNFSKLYEKLM